MTPISLIIFGLVVIGVTLWNIRNEEADVLFWMNITWWDVNKSENPLLYRIAITLQFLGGFGMLGVGVIWLIYFR